MDDVDMDPVGAVRETPSVLWRPDPWLCLGVCVVMGLGLVALYSSSAVYALRTLGDAEHFLKAQLWRIGIGVVALLGMVVTPPGWLRRRSGWFLVAATVLCGIVLIPGVGRLIGGARRWLTVGPFNLQPGELAKLAVVLVLASLLARREANQDAEKLPFWLPISLVQIPIFLVLLEPDFGSAMVMEGIVVVLLFIAGFRMRSFLLAAVCASPVVYHSLFGTPFRLRRLMSYLDPWAYRDTVGYQSAESQISIGSGGFFGVGLGESKQRLFFLPEAHTDFVFAILAEEMGLIGVLVMLAGFGLIFWRGMRLAMDVDDAFERLLAIGVTSLLAIPTVFNLGVVTGLLPTKGLPLPFVSYGGSNIVVCLMAVGMLFRIDADRSIRSST